jgi:hypothetical protein
MLLSRDRSFYILCLSTLGKRNFHNRISISAIDRFGQLAARLELD